ncbi:hypothetical protein O3M35_003183 [Rhynocoris fuscipes]|uniref:Cytochrome P450 n=1 Tax=Rhynocoris fuscipes TaxID=488301 RepID=A0AAW1CI74_9HEMI
MLTAVSIVLLSIVTLLLWKHFQDYRQFVAYGDKIPGPKRLPFVGNAMKIPKTRAGTLKILEHLVKRYGHISRLWLGNILVVSLSDADDCEVILRDPKHITKAVKLYYLLHPWLGTGLLTSSGEKWHSRRKAITPTFHFKILEQFTNIFDKNTTVLINRLKEYSDGKIFDVQPLISRYALDIICETAMGVQINAQNDPNSSYFTSVRNLCQLLTERARKPWLRNDLLYTLIGKRREEDKLIKTLHDFTNSVIRAKSVTLSESEQTSNNLDEGIKKKTAFLEMLLKMKMSGNPAFKTYSDIREEVDTFMFEGHDTTSVAISFALVQISKHKDVQDKIYDEVASLVESGADISSYESLQMMKYLECVIKESLRLFPSVPFIGRELFEDVYLPSGYTVPKGTLLLISVYLLHRNEKYFPNPDVFNPDNFLYESNNERHPYAYIPFSAGPRNCIGQKFAMLELKSVLAKIILEFEIEPADDGWELKLDPNVVLQSCSGYRIKLKPRMKVMS